MSGCGLLLPVSYLVLDVDRLARGGKKRRVQTFKAVITLYLKVPSPAAPRKKSPSPCMDVNLSPAGPSIEKRILSDVSPLAVEGHAWREYE